MADAELKIKVGAEVELEPGPLTVAWLESLGWIRPDAPSKEMVSTDPEPDEEYDPRPDDVFQTLEDLVPPSRPLRGPAMTGAEAMRYRAQQLRTRLRGELADEGAQNDLDELLRMCDVDMKRVFGEDCDC